MANSKAPTFVRVQYHSQYAPHTADFLTREWIPVSDTHPLGAVPIWDDDSALDLLEMLTNLVGKLANFYGTDTVFDVATVYTQASPDVLAVPRVSVLLEDLAGSAETPGYTKAVQETVTFRTAAGGVAKIVMLDCGSFGNFDTTRGGSFAGDLDDLAVLFTSSSQAWSGQDNTRPNVPLGAFKTLNEKLRKAYRET